MLKLTPGVNCTKLWFLVFFRFSLLSLAILKYKPYFLLLQTLKLNNKKWKKIFVLRKKKFGRIDSYSIAFFLKIWICKRHLKRKSCRNVETIIYDFFSEQNCALKSFIKNSGRCRQVMVVQRLSINYKEIKMVASGHYLKSGQVRSGQNIKL